MNQDTQPKQPVSKLYEQPIRLNNISPEQALSAAVDAVVGADNKASGTSPEDCDIFLAALASKKSPFSDATRPAATLIASVKVDGSSSPMRKVGYTGEYVALQLAGEASDANTYLGLYIGDLATNAELAQLVVKPTRFNPAIFVFQLNRVVMGLESWWKVIKDPADLSQISDSEINNTWYVQALAKLSGNSDE